MSWHMVTRPVHSVSSRLLYAAVIHFGRMSERAGRRSLPLFHATNSRIPAEPGPMSRRWPLNSIEGAITMKGILAWAIGIPIPIIIILYFAGVF
ncbi:hypothetical protein [Phaeovulum sp. W22_SRMD_FR3]|uniref:hypothetical protein n=1 Tax=Phaeovulum sp. W22_SRMD_FR3 TaxID=3240274 RepID=UPI003F9685F6